MTFEELMQLKVGDRIVATGKTFLRLRQEMKAQLLGLVEKML